MDPLYPSLDPLYGLPDIGSISSYLSPTMVVAEFRNFSVFFVQVAEHSGIFHSGFLAVKC